MSNVTAQAELTKQVQQFSTPDEEIAYLKGKLAETITELNEFQESSRELETEYETQIQQLEIKSSEYQNKCVRLEAENDLLKTKYSNCINDTQHKLNDYQKQLSILTESNTRLSNYIRELEQSNDDLERTQRALEASLKDFEGQLNQQIERNVLLENEISEKDELECLVQRLKEEVRDSRHELRAKNATIDPNRLKYHDVKGSASTPMNGFTGIQGEQYQQVMVDSTTSPSQCFSSHCSFPNQSAPTRSLVSPTISAKPTLDEKSIMSLKSSEPSSPVASPPSFVMSPTSRISALNIVSDLLKKVVSLESKLSATKRDTN